MNFHEVLDLINEIENQFDVDTWMINDIHAWPIIRIDLNEKLLGSISESSQKKKWTILKERIFGLFRDFCGKYYCRFIDIKNQDIIDEPRDVLLMNDGYSVSFINNKFYEFIIDPFKEILKENNYTSLHLITMSNYSIPRQSSSIFIQHDLNLVMLKAAFSFKFSESSFVHEELRTNLNHLEQFLAKRKIKWTSKNVLVNMYTIHKLEKYFFKILKLVQPKLILLCCYYNKYGMALNIAGRKLNINTVDIQHGLQSDLHIAYGRFNKIPLGGFNNLPNYFWVWSHKEREQIDKWDSRSQYHKVFIGGNLFIAKWLKSNDPDTIEFDRIIQNSIDKNKKSILITFQPEFYKEKYSGMLYDVIEEYSSKYNFILRMHPAMNKEDLLNILNFRKINIVNIGLWSTSPLFSLLRIADLNITFYSSTVLDSMEMGVKSILYSEQSKELFSDYIDSNMIRFAFDKDSICKEIDDCINSKAEKFISNTHNYEAVKFIRQFLKK